RLPIEPELPSALADAPKDPDLVDAELEAHSLEGLDWSGRAAQGLRLSESRLSSVGLAKAELSRARFRDVVVLDGDWANATGTDGSFSRVRFERVRLTGADLSGCGLDNVTFSDCRLDLCSFRFSRLESVRFEGCKMEESD